MAEQDAQVAGAGGQRGLHVGAADDVAVAVQRAVAGGDQLIGQALAGGVRHVPQRHRGAVAHEAAGTGFADALGAAGDDDDAGTLLDCHQLIS